MICSAMTAKRKMMCIAGIFKTMRNWGNHLQLSVFECELNRTELVRLKASLKEVINSKTNEKRSYKPPPQSELSFKPENLNLVRQAMVDVMLPGGTAAPAGAGAGYSIAGKTGTAQVIAIKQGEKYDARKIDERHRDHALFIGFAPADKPKIALALLVENGGGGGGTASPIAREIFDYYLLGKQPDLTKRKRRDYELDPSH
jgi:penicillin-binding protein 2